MLPEHLRVVTHVETFRAKLFKEVWLQFRWIVIAMLPLTALELLLCEAIERGVPHRICRVYDAVLGAYTRVTKKKGGQWYRTTSPGSCLALVGPSFFVEVSIEERMPPMGDVVEETILANGNLQGHAANVRADLLLPHERCLVLRAADHDGCHLTRVADVVLVVVSDEDDGWLLTTLQGLHNLLRNVGERVRSAATSMHDSDDLRHTVRGDEVEIPLHVAEVLEVGTAGFFRCTFNVLPDVRPGVLDVPTFVVIACDEARDDTLPLGPVLDEVVYLRIHAMDLQVVPVEACLAVDHVPALQHLGDAFALPDVEEGIEDVKAFVLRTEVVVAGDAKLQGLPEELRRVDVNRVLLDRKF